MADRTCPRCRMSESRWLGGGGEGVVKDGTTYCCQGCADDTGCTCPRG